MGTVKVVDSPPRGPAVAEPTSVPEKRITTASPGANRSAAAFAPTTFPGAPTAGCNVSVGGGSQPASMNAVAARTRTSPPNGLVRWSAVCARTRCEAYSLPRGMHMVHRTDPARQHVPSAWLGAADRLPFARTNPNDGRNVTRTGEAVPLPFSDSGRAGSNHDRGILHGNRSRPAGRRIALGRTVGA